MDNRTRGFAVKAAIPKGLSPERACREQYVRFLASIYRTGLDSNALQNSRLNLCERLSGKCYLREIAYRPTGIALGCPLPDKHISTWLASITNNVTSYLRSLNGAQEDDFAHVPVDWYHITIVNQAHYAAGSEKVKHSPFSPVQEQQLRNLLCDAGPLVVQLDRVILTSRGGLLVAGYPMGNSLYNLRQKITQTIPSLDINTPKTAHIKLGHLQTDLSPDALRELLKYLRQGSHIDKPIQFEQAYSPSGFFSLNAVAR
jgi:hypothetical protein